jgi:hypothetical protein
VVGSHFLLLKKASHKSRPQETEGYVEVMEWSTSRSSVVPEMDPAKGAKDCAKGSCRSGHQVRER